MAGQPKQRELAARIEEAGGDATIFARIADAEPIKKIADSFGVSRQALYNWRDADEARKQNWTAAVEQSAFAHAEKAAEVLSEAVTKDGLSSAMAKIFGELAQNHRWMAARFNRPQFGDAATQVNVGLNFGDLHMEALKAQNVQIHAMRAIEAGEPIALPAEIIGDEAA